MLPLLTSAYLAPIQWYAKLFHSNGCWIEQHDHFQKQTYRNRCIIATGTSPHNTHRKTIGRTGFAHGYEGYSHQRPWQLATHSLASHRVGLQ